jgi:hypothetical protein
LEALAFPRTARAFLSCQKLKKQWDGDEGQNNSSQALVNGKKPQDESQGGEQGKWQEGSWAAVSCFFVVPKGYETHLILFAICCRHLCCFRSSGLASRFAAPAKAPVKLPWSTPGVLRALRKILKFPKTA